MKSVLSILGLFVAAFVMAVDVGGETQPGGDVPPEAVSGTVVFQQLAIEAMKMNETEINKLKDRVELLETKISDRGSTGEEGTETDKSVSDEVTYTQSQPTYYRTYPQSQRRGIFVRRWRR